jgi:two-component system, sensor histidine kinase and response regulator
MSLQWSRLIQPQVLHQIFQLLQEIAGVQGRFLTNFQAPIGWHDDSEANPDAANLYTIVVTETFSALLQAEFLVSGYRIQLNFVPETIAQFLQALPNAPKIAPIQPNEPQKQTEFTLKLIDILTLPKLAEVSPETTSLAEQAQLLNQVTQAIRQSLELPAILATAVQQVRSFLQVDRLLIHQLNIPAPACDLEGVGVIPHKTSVDGITYEARAHENIPSLLNQIGDQWINAARQLRTKYSSGEIAAKENVEGISELATMVKFSQDAAVRSELTVPILVQGELWGLLIAHQCDSQRQWTQLEKTFLQQIVDQLSIAIYQSKLFSQLQEQTNSLEKAVIERTQELQDTLVVAQAADRAKSEFLATMSHELRTPLTCIIGMSATLLRTGMNSFLPLERQQSHLQIIHDRGENLLTLINDILALSNIETGQTVLNVRHFSLSQLASQTLKEFEVKASQKEIRLVLDIPNDVMANGRFKADPQRVRQILLNLLSNAIKFTPSGGLVILRVRVFQEVATIQVEDTGVGIPEHQHHLIFQKFQQLDSSYRRKYEGTGLGLALTKQLVELQGGKIEFTSQVDVGSVFTVKLSEQALSMNGLVRDREKLSVYARVMLIEGVEEQANLICDLLTAADYQVIWMTDAETAIYQLQATQAMITIVDCQQPESEQIVMQLKAAAQDSPMKILAILPEGESAARWRQIGADECVAMTIDAPEQLVDKVTVLTHQIVL